MGECHSDSDDLRWLLAIGDGQVLGAHWGTQGPKIAELLENFRPNETYFISIIDYMVYVKMTEASHHNCIRPYSYYSQQLPPLGTALAFLHRMEHPVTSERVDQPLSG